MNIVLVYPRFKYPSGDIPYGLLSVASFIREKTDVNVFVLDTTFNPSFDYVKRFLKQKRPSIVGIYTNTIAFYDALKVARIAKGYGSFVIMGGPHATILPNTLISDSNVDAVVIGEGEVTLKEIIERLQLNEKLNDVKGIWFRNNGEVIKEQMRRPIEDVDSLPFPAWDLLDMKKYLKNWFAMDSVSPSLKGVYTMASRGCPFNCTYCQPTLRKIFGRRVRWRSPKKVVDEIKILIERYNIDAFHFIDDTLTASRSWVESFCELMKNEKIKIIWGCNTRANTIDKKLMKTMRNAGLRKICIGGESASQRILDDIYRKGIKVEDVKKTVDDAKRLGIKTQVYFMIGAPTETVREIKKTIKFAVSLNADEVTFSITTPLPETYLYDFVKRNYSMSNNFEDYDYYSKRAFDDRNIKELLQLQKIALFLFYIHPKRWPYLFKSFSSLKSIRKLRLKLKRIE